MTVMLLTEHHLEFLSLKEAVQALLTSLHLSKYHIVGNHMSRLIYIGHCLPLHGARREKTCFRDLNTAKAQHSLCIFDD